MIQHIFKLSALSLLVGIFSVQQGDCGGDDDTPTPTPDYEFWIGDTGPTGPLWSGEQQYPFICYTVESNLGQPIIDNQDSRGNAVFPEVNGQPDYEAEPLGYSEMCSMYTRVDYFYYSTSDGHFYLYDANNPPSDLDYITIDGQVYPFLVRVETGTINRFIYTIAMLAPYPEDISSPSTLNNDFWNQKLLIYLRGGVGIGHWQGEGAWHGGISGSERPAFRRLLGDGYAVVMTSGNETGVHYNMQLADETAWMTKQHFINIYGEPRYTISVGGSGGGIQQYMFAQNRPGMIDAGIPLYSYPDMVTQTIYVGDCNLLEQYFMEDVELKGDSSKWATWSHRQWIEGLNASDTVTNTIWGNEGSTECIEAWWFAEPLALNPEFTLPDYIEGMQQYGYSQAEISAIKWTHFNDLEQIYGVDARGYAPIPFDNEGVQYGLQALRDGKITSTEFLEINSCVGSWKEQDEYIMWDPTNDPFDARNMNRDPDACRNGEPSPRRVGDFGAMNAAYESGQVFHGDLAIPMIDLRPYLEDELDMHNTRQSFAVRQRLIDHDGDADEMVIWFTGSEDDVYNRLYDALDILDDYLLTGVKPTGFQDKCHTADGQLIAEGPTVWDGILNNNAAGACTDAYKTYSSARMVAGDRYAGTMFKCGLKAIDAALSDGTYGNTSFNPDELAFLRQIFSSGVCDYSQPDQGLPEGW